MMFVCAILQRKWKNVTLVVILTICAYYVILYVYAPCPDEYVQNFLNRSEIRANVFRTKTTPLPGNVRAKSSDDPNGLDQSDTGGHSTKVTRPHFTPDEPHLLLIVSYQRTGSSFLGGLFATNPHVFYAYEPLDAFYSHLYGTREGWNVPSDITHFANGSQRWLPAEETEGAATYLDDLFHCRLDQLPVETFLHGFWDQFARQHKALSRALHCYRYFNGKSSRSPVYKCQNVLRGQCAERLGQNWTKTEPCKNGLLEARSKALEDLKPGRNFEGYLRCMEGKRRRFDTCLQHFAEACTARHTRVIKTVRATMGTIGVLLARNPNLRVVHLVRDPRAVVVSRSEFGGSANGLYSDATWSGILDNEEEVLGATVSSESRHHRLVDIVKEAHIYCSATLNDIRVRRTLERQHPPGTFLEIVYDDFVQNPDRYALEMHALLNVTYPDMIKKWLRKNTRELVNSSSIASKWQDKLTFRESRQIIDTCRDFLRATPSLSKTLYDL